MHPWSKVAQRTHLQKFPLSPDSVEDASRRALAFSFITTPTTTATRLWIYRHPPLAALTPCFCPHLNVELWIITTSRTVTPATAHLNKNKKIYLQSIDTVSTTPNKWLGQQLSMVIHTISYEFSQLTGCLWIGFAFQSRPLAHANFNTSTIHTQNLRQYNIQDAYTQLQQTYNTLLEEHSTLKQVMSHLYALYFDWSWSNRLNFRDLNTKLSESR